MNIFPSRLVDSVNGMIGKVKVLVARSLSFNATTVYQLELKDQDGNIIDTVPITISNVQNLQTNLTDKENRITALEGFKVVIDQAAATVTFQDANNVTLATANLGFLNNEGTTFVYNDVDKTLELYNDAGDLLSTIPVSSFVSNLAKSLGLSGATITLYDTENNVLSTITLTANTINTALGYTAANDADLQAHISDLTNPHQVDWGQLLNKPSTFDPSPHTLDSHSNVTITSNTSGEILKWNGTAWVNNTLSEAGISAVGHVHDWSDITTGVPTTLAGFGLQTEADTRYVNEGQNIDWSTVINTPTTLSGYGITDAYTSTFIDANFDNYQSWNLLTNNVQRTTITSGGNLDLVAQNNISVSYSAGGVVTFDGTHTHTVSDITDFPTNLSYFTNDLGFLTTVTFGDIDAGAYLTSLEAFSDVDTQLMTAAAINDLIESKGYLTTETDSQTLTFNSTNGDLSISNGNTVSLDTRYLTSEVNDLTSAVTWATVPDLYISQSSVTQHEAALTITESQISDLGNYSVVGHTHPWSDINTTPTTLSGYGITDAYTSTYINNNFAPLSHTLGSHSDVTITSNTTGEILKWNGTAWINNTLTEAGIAAAVHTHPNISISAGTGLTGGGTLAQNRTLNFDITWGDNRYSLKAHTHPATDITVSGTDWNNNVANRFQLIAGNVNSPVTSTTYVGAKFTNSTGAFSTTLAGRNDIFYVRTRENGVDQSWRKLWHNGNLVNLSDLNDDLVYDNYQSWNLRTNGVQRTTVGSGGVLDLVGGNNVTLSYGAGGVVTIDAATGGTDTNNYLTGVSGAASGNVTFTRDGLTDIVWDASHTHPWSEITSTPTTISGYGITDNIAYTDVNNNFSVGQTILVSDTAVINDTLKLANNGSGGGEGNSIVFNPMFSSEARISVFRNGANSSENIMTFSTANASGSTEAMRIDPFGNVGIGMTTTSEKLNVSGNVLADSFINSTSDDTYMLLGGGGTKLLSDFVSSTTFNTHTHTLDEVLTAGNTSALSATVGDLTANGHILSNRSYPSIYVSHDGTTLGGVRADALTKLEFKTLTTAPLSFQVNSSEKMRVTDNGNVGIGTTSPDRRLSVFDNSSSMVASFRSASGNDSFIQFSNNSSIADAVRIGSSSRSLVLSTEYVPRLTIAQNGDTTVSQNFIVDGLSNQAGIYDIENSIVRVVNPKGGSANLGTSATGAIKIAFPFLWSNSMFGFQVDIYSYQEDKSITIFFEGHPSSSSSSWTGVTAKTLTSDETLDLDVRVGHDGVSTCIWIGETTTTWSHPKVQISNFYAGHSNFTSQWAEGWSISVVTTFDTVQLIKSLNLPYSDWNKTINKPTTLAGFGLEAEADSRYVNVGENVDWSTIINTPTTIAGYGITNAYTKTESDNRFFNVTGDTVTGNSTFDGNVTVTNSQFLVDTSNGLDPFIVGRYINSTVTENIRIWVEDIIGHFYYTEDERNGRIRFTLDNTDSSNGGVNANLHTFEIVGNENEGYLQFNGSRLITAANISNYQAGSHTHTEADITDLGDYLPRDGSLPMTGGLRILRSDGAPVDLLSSSDTGYHTILKSPAFSQGSIRFQNNQSSDLVIIDALSKDATFYGKIIKSGSSDSYMLLGGGGTSLLTNFIQDNGINPVSDFNTTSQYSYKYRWNNTSVNRPAQGQSNQYGTLLNLQYDSVNVSQIAHDHAQNHLHIRRLDTNTDVAGNWNEVWDSGNLTALSQLTNDLNFADQAYVDTQVAALVDSSPDALNTLNELAAALGDDPNFATTVTNDLATKALKTTTISAGTGLTGGGDLSANRTISFDTTWGDARYLTSIPNLQQVTDAGSITTTNVSLNGGVQTEGLVDIGASISGGVQDPFMRFHNDWNTLNLESGHLSFNVFAKGDSTTGTYLHTHSSLDAYRWFSNSAGYRFQRSINTTGVGQTASWIDLLRIETSAFTYQGNNVYHSGNLTDLSQLNDDVVSGNYLPLTGGTLTGGLIVSSAGYANQLTLNRTDGSPYLFFKESGTTVNQFYSTSTVFQIRDGSGGVLLQLTNSGNDADFSGNVSAPSFKKDGGTSSQFLKADGSVDNNEYLRGVFKSYGNGDISGDTGDQWYNIFQIGDSTNGAVTCNIKAYAHTSLSFVVTKGFGGNVDLTILSFSKSPNEGFRYIKGIRVIDTGSGYFVQLKLNRDDNDGITTTDIEMQLYGADVAGLNVPNSLTPYTGTVNSTPVLIDNPTEGFTTGSAVITNNITAGSVAISTGQSYQFLKADGSLDGTSYLPLTGGNLSGHLHGTTISVGADNRSDIGRLYVSKPSGDTAATLRLASTGDSDSNYIRFQNLDAGGVKHYADIGFDADSRKIYFRNPHGNSYTVNIDTAGKIESNGFIKSGGTTSQFLKADGSVTEQSALSITESQISDFGSYLPLSGGDMSGKIRFVTSSTNNGFEWVVNSDSAGINFKNTGDGDSNSNFAFFTKDNGNEYFKFHHQHYQNGNTDYMDIKDGAIRVNGNIYINAAQSGDIGLGTNTLTGGDIVASQAWVTSQGYLTSQTDSQTLSWNGTNGDLSISNGNTINLDGRYLESFTETDPTVPSHVKSITTTEKNNWNTAYSWGDHSTQGYLTSFTETDTLQSVTDRGNTTTNNINATGLSTSWGTTSGVNTGGVNVIMGTSTSATWLLSGTSGGVFRGGIQALDGGGITRYYTAGNYFQFQSNTLSAVNMVMNGSTVATQSWVTSQGYLTSYSETDTLQSVTDRGNTTTNPIILNTATTGNPFEITNSGTLRTQVDQYGRQTWWLNSGSSETGYITYATPAGRSGIVFFDSSGASRSQMVHTAGGGIEFGSNATSGAPTNNIFLSNSGSVTANSFVKSGATNDDVLLGDGTTTSLAALGGGTPTLQQVTDSGNTTTNKLRVTTAANNITPAVDELLVDGYGIIGSRGTLYITNNLNTVQIGNGSIHNSDPGLSVATNSVVSHRNFYTKNIFPNASDGLNLYGDNNDGSSRGANVNIGGNVSPHVNATIGDPSTTLAGQFNVTNRSATTLGSATFDKIGTFRINSDGVSDRYHLFTDSYYEFSNSDTLKSRTRIGLGEVLMFGGAGGNNHFYLKQLGSMTSLMETNTGLNIDTGGVNGTGVRTTLSTTGLLTLPTGGGFAISGKTSDDVLLGDGTTISQSSLGGGGGSGSLQTVTDTGNTTTNNINITNNTTQSGTGLYISSTSGVPVISLNCDTSAKPSLIEFNDLGVLKGQIVLDRTTNKIVTGTSTNDIAMGTVSGSSANVHLFTEGVSRFKIDSTGNATFDGGNLTVNGTYISDNTQSRDKIRVWSSSNYAIGMQNGYTYGALNNNYAMSFQMDVTAGRGFWWGTTGHTNAQGAMSLGTDGKLTVATSMRIGYGTSDTTIPGTTYRIQANGDMQATDFVGSSDIRFKKDITELEVKKLDTVYKNYKFKDDEKESLRTGVIAQELEKHHPEFVRTDNDGTKSVSYQDLHSAEIAYLKEENKRLSDKLDKLEKLVEKLLK